MADHPAITPEELATAAETYLRTGSFTEAAKAIGRERTGVMRALRRSSPDHVRAQVYARALDGALSRVAADVSRTAAELRADARGAKKPSERASAAAALNDAARTLNQLRTAQAKLTGSHAPERTDVTSDGQSLSGAYAALEAGLARATARALSGAAGGGPSDPVSGGGGDPPA